MYRKLNFNTLIPHVTVQALDPEGDAASYTLVGGNELNHFDIGESSGTLRIADHLDRESLDLYTLVGPLGT